MIATAPRMALASIVILLAVGDPAAAQQRGRPGGGGGMVGVRGGGPRPGFGGSPSFSGGGNFNRQPNFSNVNIQRQFVPVRQPNNVNFNNRRNFVNNNANFINNNTNINNRTNFVNNANINVNNVGNRLDGGGFGGYGGYRGYPGGAYAPYHRDWVNGYWHGNYGGGWGGNGYGNGYPYGGYGYGGGNFAGNALGVGLGVGLASWGLGSLFNNFGYSSYSNPYYSASTTYLAQPVGLGVPAASPYDYSRPLDFASPPPGDEVVNRAVAGFADARESFRVGDYARALTLTDEALTRTANDPMLHEFRAIILFAQQRYDEAAVPLYTVLSAGPGWDWTTLIGLYADVETYTAQLRTLEAYCNTNPRAASARFLLAALYLTQGSNPAAAVRLREVVAIRPQDRLSAQLLAALDAAAQPALAANPAQPLTATGAPANPATPPADNPPADPVPAEAPPLPTGPVPARLFGTWSAAPAKDVAISLTLAADKSFTWKVTEKGQAREFHGDATADNDVIALAAPQMPPMIAKVTWSNDTRFNFKAVGAPADDPGLDFAKGSQ